MRRGRAGHRDCDGVVNRGGSGFARAEVSHCTGDARLDARGPPSSHYGVPRRRQSSGQRPTGCQRNDPASIPVRLLPGPIRAGRGRVNRQRAVSGGATAPVAANAQRVAGRPDGAIWWRREFRPALSSAGVRASRRWVLLEDAGELSCSASVSSLRPQRAARRIANIEVVTPVALAQATHVSGLR